MMLVEGYLAQRFRSPGLEAMPLDESPNISNEANEYSLIAIHPAPEILGQIPPGPDMSIRRGRPG